MFANLSQDKDQKNNGHINTSSKNH
uniref:Uncharacterized protein n=1 Tax=Arundo donax TaxID=35708 RepID=A0A0A9H296_ARUDO